MLSKRKKKEKQNVKSQLMSPLKNYETRKHDAILKNAYRKSVIVIKLYNNHIYIYIIHIIYILSFYFYQLVIAKVWNQGKKERKKKEISNITTINYIREKVFLQFHL